jgi:lysophospholipase L1-like esterase
VLWSLIGTLVVLLIVVELVGRRIGLHTPVLYEATAYGYRVAPNQDIRRFGNRVFYNAQGLRSEPSTAKASVGTTRILCIGDSVTYGGTQSDQSVTYPYLLAAALKRRGANTEVLNASAGGWAPENALGWMQAMGLFDSRIVIIQLGTHDLVQRPAAAEVVGRHPQFPDRSPALALQAMASRLWVKLVRDRHDSDGTNTDSNSAYTRADADRVNRTVDRLIEMIRIARAEPLILFVEQPAALEPRDELTEYAKAELTRLADRHQVRIVHTAPALDRQGGTANYRDAVHPNEAGNRILAELLADALPKLPS